MAASSMHFKASEFACPHCGEAFVRQLLLRRLESLRAHVARPIHIVSGYRCPVHNHAVGGAKDSMHVYGAAADILPGVCTAPEAAHVGFVGIGTKGMWAIHVDVRDGLPARWKY